VSKFFINHPIVSIVIAIFFVIAGAVMVFRLPIAQFPDIVPPQIQTTAIYTGADALTVEASVATPIEQQVNGAKNMIYMQSINGNDGTMTLEVSFEVGTNVDLDQVQVQNRLAQATSSLPAQVSTYGLTTQQTVGIPLLVFTISSPNRTWDQTFLANYVAINITDELARIPGIGQVKSFGAANDASLGRAGYSVQASIDGCGSRECDRGAERRQSRGSNRRTAGAGGPASHLHRACARPLDERGGVRRHHRSRQPRW
jgi:HAE1 family hydrophobic/amphiphilic exporter-1